MTRLYTDGAEFGDTVFWDVATGVVAHSDYHRTGNYAYMLGTGTTAKKTISPISEFYGKHAGWQNYGFPGVEWMSGATVLGDIAINSSGNLQARVNGTIVATSTQTYSGPSTWNLIEFHVKIDDAPNGIIQGRLNGILVIDYTGDTLVSSYTTVDGINYKAFLDNQALLDDIALNDTNGSYNNSWCGDGHIVIITPSGSGVNNQWLNSGSVSGSANYLYVDDFPKDDDTSYVWASGSSGGSLDQYRMTSFNIGNVDILQIYAEGRLKKAAADDDYVRIGYLVSGSTKQVSGSIPLSTNYGRIIGTSASVNPGTGLSWTTTEINTIEYVTEVG